MSTAVSCVVASDSSPTTISTRPWSSNTSPNRKPRKPIHVYSLNMLADGGIQLFQNARSQPLPTAANDTISAPLSEPAHVNISNEPVGVSQTILSNNRPTYTSPLRGPPRNIYFHRPTIEEIERKKRREKRLVEELQASKELELFIRSSKGKKTQIQARNGSSVPTDSDASSDAHAGTSLNPPSRQSKKRGPKSGIKSKRTHADKNSTLKPTEVFSSSPSAHLPPASSRRSRRNMYPPTFERPLTRSKAGSHDLVTVANTQSKDGDISMAMQQTPEGEETTLITDLMGAAEQTAFIKLQVEPESQCQPEPANTTYTSSGGSTPSCPSPVRSFPTPDMAPVARELSPLTVRNGNNDSIAMEKSFAIEVNVDIVKAVVMKASRKRKATEEMDDSSKSDTPSMELRRSGRVTKKRNVVS